MDEEDLAEIEELLYQIAEWFGSAEVLDNNLYRSCDTADGPKLRFRSGSA